MPRVLSIGHHPTTAKIIAQRRKNFPHGLPANQPKCSQIDCTGNDNTRAIISTATV